MSKTKTAKMLPKTVYEIENGGIYAQSVRCGKLNCKCAKGKLHLAYYFFTRLNRKLVKFYIRKSQVDSFTQLVNEAAELRQEAKFVSKSTAQLMKTFSQLIKEARIS